VQEQGPDSAGEPLLLKSSSTLAILRSQKWMSGRSLFWDRDSWKRNTLAEARQWRIGKVAAAWKSSGGNMRQLRPLSAWANSGKRGPLRKGHNHKAKDCRTKVETKWGEGPLASYSILQRTFSKGWEVVMGGRGIRVFEESNVKNRGEFNCGRVERIRREATAWGPERTGAFCSGRWVMQCLG